MAGFGVKAPNERNCDRAGSEGDDDSGNDHRLGNRVKGKTCCRAAPCDNSKNEEDAAADQIEGQQFAQRVGVHNEAIKPETDQSRSHQSRENRSRHGSGLSSGGPATSIGSATAMDNTMNVSMNRMMGFAKLGG